MTSTHTTERAVTTAEMAALLRIGTEKLRLMAKAGEIPYLSLGRKFGFLPSRVFDALERKHENAVATGRSERSHRARRTVL